MFRGLILLVLCSALSISAYYRSRARRDGGTIPRRSEARQLVALRLLVTLPFLAGLLLYLLNPDSMAWASLSLPRWVRWLGFGIGLGAVASARWVLGALGRNVSETVLTKPQHELVTHGPYRWIRHPLYSTGLLLLVAVGLMAANWWMLGWTVLVLLFFRFVVIPVEEQHLLAKFGDRYRAYMNLTERLAPSLRAGGHPQGFPRRH